MAGQFALTLGLILVITLARYLLPTNHPSTSPSISPPKTGHLLRIEGRWKAFRTSLGLPPVSDHVFVASDPVSLSSVSAAPRRGSRFDLRRKRALEESESSLPVPLYFSKDALEEPSLTTDQIIRAFRAVALTEKEIAADHARWRVPEPVRKTQRRQSRWPVMG